MSSDVLIIGGGLHGCSVALHCVMAGMKVTVVEREAVGRHASGVNAGGVRSLRRHVAEIPLSLASNKIWQSIEDLVDDDCGYSNTGQIMVALDEADMEAIHARRATMDELGYAHEEVIGPNEVYDLLPALASGCPGALIVREDGAANPYRTTMAFRDRAARSGARFKEGVAVLGLARDGSGWRVSTTDGDVYAQAIINCAGAWSATVCSWLGESVPLTPIAPMMTITAPLPPFVSPVVLCAGRPLSFKQMANGTVMIGGGYSGTADLKTGLTSLRLDRLSTNLATAAKLFPLLDKVDIVRFWAGVEASMPDGIPVIGPSRQDGVFHAFGFSAHGFQLGPIVGRIMAELVQGRRSPLPIEPFSISRFLDESSKNQERILQ